MTRFDVAGKVQPSMTGSLQGVLGARDRVELTSP